MTNSVLRINPWAEISMLKVQSTRSAGRRTIYAQSAAAAIKDCVDRNFDIISMSWTVRNMYEESNSDTAGEQAKARKLSAEEFASKELRDAVRAAERGKILMFYAASNEITTTAKDMLPYTAAPDYIFRIGPADALGQRDTAVASPDEISYYCPGNRVVGAWDERSLSQIEYHNGSSVATALAAGLASIILYCAAILEAHYKKGSEEHSRIERLYGELRTQKGMAFALDNIDKDNEWAKRKYLPVWDRFGKAAAVIKENDKAVGIRELTTLINILYPLHV